MLHTRALHTAFEKMGYVLEERLPPTERPGQHDLSTAAYLQIAAEIPPDRIIVLNLEMFQRLVSATLTELYPVYARYAHPRNITVDRLFEISHLVVRDTSHILSREPPAPQPPVPSSLMTPAHMLSEPTEVLKTIQFLAFKFAEAPASTKPPPADTSAADARASSAVASNALGSQLPPTAASTPSGAQAPPSASATTSGKARPHTPIPSRAQAPEPSASSSLSAQGPLADASVASASASIPSDANLQEPGADEEPFTHNTGAGFDSSAYSEVLDRKLADIRTPVIPSPERFAQPEAPRKKLAEPAVNRMHTKRARHSSPTTSIAPAASPPKSPDARTPPSTRRLPPVAEVSARSTPHRTAAEQADASRRATLKERTPPEWSNESEAEHPQPSSSALPAAKVRGRKLILELSSESSELSNVNATASRGRPRRSRGATRDKERRRPSRGQCPRSETSATSTAAPEGAAAKEENELPMTVTVPGMRQEIAKRTSRKVQSPQVFKAWQLAARVNAIWTDFEHGTKENFHPDSPRVVQYAKNAYNYLHVHGGDLLRDVRSMFAEVQWKVLADFLARSSKPTAFA